MYHYKETGLISKLLTIATALILVVGIIAGINYGGTLMQPTEEAAEAIQELTTDSYDARYRTKQLLEKAEEKEWTFDCTIAMFEVWIVAGILALFTFCKRHQLEMLDQITLCLDKPEHTKTE